MSDSKITKDYIQSIYNKTALPKFIDLRLGDFFVDQRGYKKYIVFGKVSQNGSILYDYNTSLNRLFDIKKRNIEFFTRDFEFSGTDLDEVRRLRLMFQSKIRNGTIDGIDEIHYYAILAYENNLINPKPKTKPEI